MKKRTKGKVEILGVKVDGMKMGEVVEKLEEVVKKDRKALVVTPNPEMILKAQEDEEFRGILNGAEVAVPDGVGLLAAAKYLQLVQNSEFRIQNSVKDLPLRVDPPAGGGVEKMGRRGETRHPELDSGSKDWIPDPSNSAGRQIRNDDGQVSSNSNLFDIVQRVGLGLRVGWAVVFNRKFLNTIPEQVAGDKLFERLIKLASERGWRVFLLGGEEGVAKEAGRRLMEKYPKLEIETSSGAVDIKGELRIQESEFRSQKEAVTLRAKRSGVEKSGVRRWPGFSTSSNNNNDEIIKVINKFRPQMLFVAYGAPWQEKWLARNWDKLKVNVGMGIGGTLDEMVGVVSPTPEWLRRLGLRWLWRLIRQPRRVARIWRAVVVFAWRVFRST
jgi:N-acetylglucosaminyldiphosphoundecaprenol N-acetyl-beta-D-mannosaminyltransferase